MTDTPNADKTPPASQPAADAKRLARMRRRLLRWYRRHHRKLPWRPEPGELPDAYHVLVSEAMLQQTQVATVVDYFHRFLAAFPTVTDLAAASEQQVLHLWQGLGYYRRARHLHAAAKKIVEDYDGQMPTTAEALRSLPGVGPYTAAAVASIAFHETEAVVDGNVIRVLARTFHINEPVDQPAVQRQLWTLADQLVSPKHPGDFNQAMMELGATVCMPRNPQCLVCPWREDCQARAAGDPLSLPVKKSTPKQTAVTHLVAVVQRRGRWLVEQRPEQGLWSRMWQLPTLELPPKSPAPPPSASADEAIEKTQARERLAQHLQQRFGLQLQQLKPLDIFTHQTTHRRIRFIACATDVTGRLKTQSGGVWRSPKAIEDLPFSNPQRRIFRMANPTS